MTMIERTFFRVGQALFCRERVNNRTIIYDCGGQTEDIVKQVIDAEYPARNTSVVDALYISHYDKDHVNGVFHLLNKCQVNHMFLPMVSSLSKMLLFIGQRYSSQMRSFYADPRAFIQQLSGNTKVHYIEQSSERSAQVEEPVDIESIAGADIPSVSLLRFQDNPDWVYIPFNRKLMTIQEETAFLQAIGLPANATFDDILKEWRKQHLALKRIVGQLGIIDIKNCLRFLIEGTSKASPRSVLHLFWNNFTNSCRLISSAFSCVLTGIKPFCPCSTLLRM